MRAVCSVSLAISTFLPRLRVALCRRVLGRSCPIGGHDGSDPFHVQGAEPPAPPEEPPLPPIFPLHGVAVGPNPVPDVEQVPAQEGQAVATDNNVAEPQPPQQNLPAEAPPTRTLRVEDQVKVVRVRSVKVETASLFAQCLPRWFGDHR